MQREVTPEGSGATGAETPPIEYWGARRADRHRKGRRTKTVYPTLSAHKTDAPRQGSTFLFVLARAAMVVVLAAVAVLLYPTGTAQTIYLVSVDGVAAAISPGTTVEHIRQARALAPRTGAALDFTGDVFGPGQGEEGAIEVNGDPAAPTLALSDGSQVVAKQGPGVLEELGSTATEIPSRMVVQGTGWAFKIAERGQPGVKETFRGTRSKRELISLTTQEVQNTVVQRSGTTPTQRKVVVLTFDDGPSSYTPQVLKILEREKIPATFFVCGSSAAGNEALLQRMRDAGHHIANHTWSHAHLAKVDRNTMVRELARTTEVIGYTPFMRPPGGSFNNTVTQAAAELGMIVTMWDVDTRDWETRTVESIMANVKAQTKPGAVILMHDGGGDRSATVAALPQVIDWLRSQGYGFTSLKELVGY
jgi:peptidoglycan/xylan/chitin deacetylase (PgdA/CDA1 family)